MSILHYQPTPDFKDTGRNVRHYVESHMDTFWEIFKPLMPYIAICLFLDLVITEHFMSIDPKTGEPYPFPLFGIIALYFYACLIVSWHRVIIHGPDNYIAMNPLKPDGWGIRYIMIGIGLFLGAFILTFIMLILHKLILPTMLPVSFIIWIIFLFFMATRLSFLFPANAIGNNISLKQAFELSEGYVLRLIIAPIFAAWKIVLLMLAYVFIGFLVLIILSMAAGALIESGPGAVVVQFLFAAPISLFFNPLLTVIGVTVLSNFYQHALQNSHKEDDDDEYYI